MTYQLTSQPYQTKPTNQRVYNNTMKNLMITCRSYYALFEKPSGATDNNKIIKKNVIIVIFNIPLIIILTLQFYLRFVPINMKKL